MTTQLHRFGALAGALLVAACSTETLLDVEDQDIIDPAAVNNASGAAALFFGAIGEFSVAVVGDGGGLEGQILVGGLMSDEYIHSGTFPTRLEYEQRKSKEDNGTLTAVFRQLHRARWLLEQAVAKLEAYAPTPPARVGEAFALAGYTYIWFGESYCSGVPFSNVSADGTTLIYGAPQTTTQIFNRAIERFDSALVWAARDTTAAGALTTAGTRIRNLALVGKARALVNLAQYGTAATVVAPVVNVFLYVTTHSLVSGRQWNGVHTFNWLSERWSVADNEGTNGLNFRSASDPRVQWFRDPVGSGVGFDNNTPQYNLWKYPSRTAPTYIADGIEAKLIIAEALLSSGSTGPWLDTLNFLRARYEAGAYGAFGPVLPAPGALPGLTDPGTTAGRVDLMFRERAFWLYATGHRLGDLRRLMRQYGRVEDAVFPTGLHFKGSNYGDDVNLPIPFDERNNPEYLKAGAQCLSRGA